MDKKTFEESLIRLLPECSRKSVQVWILFAEVCFEMGQFPDFNPVSDKDVAVGKWLDAFYKGLYRVSQKYGTKLAEQICEMSVKHTLYPWEMMEAAKCLKNGGDTDKVMSLSVEGMLDECDSQDGPEISVRQPEKAEYSPKKRSGR